MAGSSQKLVHGVFNSTANVFEATMLRLAEKGFLVSQFTWTGPREAPEFDSRDAETVVVLDVTLGSLGETFEFAWDWAVAVQGKSWRWEVFRTADDRLRLLQGAEAFQPLTFRWRRIKLDAHADERPLDVRDPHSSPGVALIHLAAQHPQRVRAIDREKRCGWFVPGLECAVLSRRSWRFVPCLDFDPASQQVALYPRANSTRGGLTIPMLRD